MENKTPVTEQQIPVDYLAELEESNNQFVHATTGQRFVNFLIDNLFMNYGLGLITGMLIGSVISAFSPELLNESSSMENMSEYILLSLLIGYLNYLIYYTLCEKLFKGYTLGKLISGTRAIRTDGTELTFKDCLLRSLCRLVPFEVFSAFGGNPWHDRWTKTMVIKAR